MTSKRFQWAIGANGSENLPLSFGKGILYEGGVRVPFIVRWPGVVPAGKVSDAVVSHLDILPTCVAAAGGKLPGDREYDGADLRPVFLRRRGRLDRPADVLAGMAGPGCADEGLEAGVDRRRAPRLYNLAADVEEEHDLAAAQPQIVARMQEAWKTWNKKNIAPLFEFKMKGGPWKNNTQ